MADDTSMKGPLDEDVEVTSANSSHSDEKEQRHELDGGCNATGGDAKTDQGSLDKDVEATSVKESSANTKEHKHEPSRDHKTIGGDEETPHLLEEPMHEIDATSVKESSSDETKHEHKPSGDHKTSGGDEEAPRPLEEPTRDIVVASVKELSADEKEHELEWSGDLKITEGDEELCPLEEPMHGVDASASSVKESSADTKEQEHVLDGDQKTNGGGNQTPQVGMMFKSYEEAMDFYNEYAQHTGFNTKIRSSSYGEDGQCKTFKLACCKSGKGPSNATKYYLSRPLAKTNCMARISAKLCGDGLFRLMDVNLEHNHPLVSVNTQYSRSNRKKPRAGLKGHIENDKAGRQPTELHAIPVVQPREHENLSQSENECKNCVERVSKLRLGKGDIEAIHQYFLTMQSKNSNFFYLVDLDEKGHLRNMFWADGRSRAAYQYFGDFVLLDTTYLTNKHDMPLASFVGVNHHGQLVLLGCSLLSNETVETYIWLFKAWLSCMSKRPPNAIITDQGEAILGAIAEVFPGTRHRLCLWQIMNKMLEKFRGFLEYKAIKKAFKKVVYDSLRVDEFEEEWKKMIEDYGLKDNEWLGLLYENRHCWAPVFVKDSFWAGMSTTQRGESMHSFFDGYVHSKTTLEKFLSNYEMVLQSKYEKEAHADFDSFQKIPQYVSKLYMEEQLCKIYTIDIFKKFQDEIKALIYCQASLVRTNRLISTFEVKEHARRNDGKKTELRNYEVIYNAKENEVQCICRSFQYRGILCRHALSVLNFQDVDEIPSKYIHKRWRKDFKHMHALPCSSSDAVANGPIERYDNLYKHCIEVVEIGLISDEKYKIALKMIGEVKEKLLVDSCAVPCTTTTGRPVGNERTDPLQAKQKGCLPQKRKDLLVEKTANTNKKKVSGATPMLDDQTDVLPIVPTTSHFGTHNGTLESMNSMEQVRPTNLLISSQFGDQVNHQNMIGSQPHTHWQFQQTLQDAQNENPPPGPGNG